MKNDALIAANRQARIELPLMTLCKPETTMEKTTLDFLKKMKEKVETACMKEISTQVSTKMSENLNALVNSGMLTWAEAEEFAKANNIKLLTKTYARSSPSQCSCSSN